MKNRSRDILVWCILPLTAIGSATGATWHVDAAATGSNNGTSWVHAFGDLNNALDVASFGDEIHVAQGTYRPDRGTGLRSYSFNLKSGVALFGGFPSGGGTLEQRSWRTILSGDLLGNDGTGDGDRDDNSQHVLFAGFVMAVTLDGFLITGGSADGVPGSIASRGGALYASASQLVVANCVFSDNVAVGYGGAIQLQNGTEATFRDCTLIRNAAESGGGAIACHQGGVFGVTNSLFLDNSAESGGGAVCANACAATYNGTLFRENRVESEFGYGGAVLHLFGSPSAFTASFFVQNSAGFGGALVTYPPSRQHGVPLAVHLSWKQFHPVRRCTGRSQRFDHRGFTVRGKHGRYERRRDHRISPRFGILADPELHFGIQHGGIPRRRNLFFQQRLALGHQQHSLGQHVDRKYL
jgi:predicted outer membrane repeat protein